MGVVALALISATAMLAMLLALLGCHRALPAASSRGRSPWAYAGYATVLGAVLALGLAGLVWLGGLFGAFVPWPVQVVALCGAASWAAWRAVGLARARQLPRRGYEAVVLGFMQACAAAAVLVTASIVYTVMAETWQFFQQVPFTEFMFGLEWSPQIAIRADQAGATGSFGMIPVLVGTLLISLVAMLVAVPLGLLSAIYLSEFAPSWVRAQAKPALEFLAGIPTVVYGFFALVTLSPILRDLGASIGVAVSGESALAAGLVIGIMTIPFVASLSEDALFAVPDELRDGSLALGGTHGETALYVVLPAALPGIVAGFLLALSRALGETMIVVMAAGLAANLTANPLEAVTTVTVQIVTMLTGDQTFDDPKTLAAFALGLLLFMFTLILNLFALGLVRKFQQQYE